MKKFLKYLEAHKSDKTICAIITLKSPKPAPGLSGCGPGEGAAPTLESDKKVAAAKKPLRAWLRKQKGVRITNGMPGLYLLIVTGPYPFWKKLAKSKKSGPALGGIKKIDGNETEVTL